LLNGEIINFKKKGKVKELENSLTGEDLTSTLGIGHTRWATHGEPNDINAHPHISGNKRLAMVHNGIIENYSSIKAALIKLGHEFESETDTEVFIHLIEEYQKRDNLSLENALFRATTKVEGAYAVVIFDKEDPSRLVAAKVQSPLVVGIGENNDFFMASDASPIVKYTDKVVYLNDGEIAVVNRDGNFSIKNKNNELQKLDIQKVDLKIGALEKEGFDHFMLKEIYQQPNTIRDGMRGRLNAKEGWAQLGGLNENMKKILNAKRFIIAACGTSWHAGLIGEYLIEELARIPVEVEYASELRYRNPIINEDDVVIALSQSGETADTVAALKLAKEKGALIYGFVNVVGSTIARMTDSGSYIHAGPEIGVASTKAFTGQVTLLTLMALKLGYEKGTIQRSYYQQLLNAMEAIPDKVQQIIEKNEQIKYIAGEIRNAQNALYLGRGYNFPVALEGALKLKEISYIHAEGYPAAEMKHGPIALIDMYMPVVVIATNKSAYEKVVSNVMEVKARKGIVIAIVTEGDTEMSKIADYTIEIPATEEPLTPLLSVIPLQLLGYHIAVMRGCDVDQPRNLAKSVTVE
jgi:glucosamine--fructose-6-phosphate aminotransferase (isomerizing)